MPCRRYSVFKFNRDWDIPGTTGDTIFRMDMNPAAVSLKNGRSTSDAARLSGSANWAVAQELFGLGGAAPSAERRA